MKIKDYIINNFKDDDINTLRTTISECLMEDDEETLPGLGVFLELIWQGADEDTKKVC
jgi:small acid-soluble spore protein I